MQVSYRGMRTGDRNFVVSGWLKSQRLHVPADLVKYVLHADNVYTTIACSDEDDDQLLGFVTWQSLPRPLLHYVFVKDCFRGHGVGRKLLKRAFPRFGDELLTVTATSKGFREYALKYRLRYNPYLLFQGDDDVRVTSP